jgi:hypothetical protein
MKGRGKSNPIDPDREISSKKQEEIQGKKNKFEADCRAIDDFKKFRPGTTLASKNAVSLANKKNYKLKIDKAKEIQKVPNEIPEGIQADQGEHEVSKDLPEGGDSAREGQGVDIEPGPIQIQGSISKAMKFADLQILERFAGIKQMNDRSAIHDRLRTFIHFGIDKLNLESKTEEVISCDKRNRNMNETPKQLEKPCVLFKVTDFCSWGTHTICNGNNVITAQKLIVSLLQASDSTRRNFTKRKQIFLEDLEMVISGLAEAGKEAGIMGEIAARVVANPAFKPDKRIQIKRPAKEIEGRVKRVKRTSE